MASSNFLPKVGHLEASFMVLKQWVHTETEDLVHFTETGVKLLPDHENDSHGAYSKVLLIKHWQCIAILGTFVMKTGFNDPRQIGAWMDKDSRKNSTRFLSNSLLTLLGTSKRPSNLRLQGTIRYRGIAQNTINRLLSTLQGSEQWYRKLGVEVGNLDFGGTGSGYMIECLALSFSQMANLFFFL